MTKLLKNWKLSQLQKSSTIFLLLCIRSGCLAPMKISCWWAEMCPVKRPLKKSLQISAAYCPLFTSQNSFSSSPGDSEPPAGSIYFSFSQPRVLSVLRKYARRMQYSLKKVMLTYFAIICRKIAIILLSFTSRIAFSSSIVSFSRVFCSGIPSCASMLSRFDSKEVHSSSSGSIRGNSLLAVYFG